MRAIDADHLKRWILSRCFKTQLSVADVIDQLDRELTIEPERKKGKWIVHYECPKCGEITKDFMEYCPFCSADMRGDSNE